MYEVLLGNKTLYYPGSDDYEIYDTELNLEVGSAGEFQFKVPPSNPLYSSLAMGTLVTVLKNNKEYWRGEIRDIKIDFAKVADVYCLEDLAWLGEEYLPPSKVTNQTYLQRLTAAINTYNSNRSADRQFTVGYVYAGSGICNWKTEYEWSILDSIRNCICRDDYYVRVRRTTSGSTVTRYIDVVRLEDYGVAASQPIEYGYNLLDYVKDSDYGNLVNVLTPYGDTLEDAAGSPIYVYDDYYKRLEGTTISNSASITAFGRHAKAVVFDGVKNLTSLNNLASAYLSRYCQPQLTMEVSAVDLAEIEPVESINLGDSVLIIAKPFAVNQRLYLTRMTIDLQSLDKNTITLSGHVARRTLTSQMQSVMDAVEEIPEESDLLKSAKANALTMLLDETQGGYVVFEYDTNNTRVEAINICNARTIDQSTKRWRWSQNGLGYLERANTSSAWPQSNIPIALTNDGSIVADRITTGAMSATRIRGGSLSLGGTGQGAYKSGSLYIYDGSSTGQAATDKLVGSWTSSGISVKAGTVTLGNKQNLTDANTGVYIGADGISAGANSVFKVTSAGALNATNATIQGAITATSGSFTGSITANSGKIGSATSAWNIGTQSIYNGCTGVDNNSAGTFVGINGIRNNDSNNHYVRITGGQISSNNCDLTGAITATSGSIAGFTISSDKLAVGNSELNRYQMSLGSAGRGLVFLAGNIYEDPDARYGMLQLSNSGNLSDISCLDGIKIYGNGKVERYDGNGNVIWTRWLYNIPEG